jgi:hypothetical protein
MIEVFCRSSTAGARRPATRQPSRTRPTRDHAGQRLRSRIIAEAVSSAGGRRGVRAAPNTPARPDEPSADLGDDAGSRQTGPSTFLSREAGAQVRRVPFGTRTRRQRSAGPAAG